MSTADAAQRRRDFGRLLRGFRSAALLSQEALAERAGLSARTVRNLESGAVGSPRGDSLARLVAGLNLTDADRVRFLCAAGVTARTDADPAPAGTDADPAPVRTAGPLSQLPAPPCDFVGRASLIALLAPVLDRPATEAPAVAVLTGDAGVGKTTLGLHVAHQLYPAFADGVLFVSLRGAGLRPAEPFEVVERLLHSLGVTGEALPHDLDDRLGLFRSLAAAKRLLILLDDAAGEEQVRPLVPSRGACALLITSRRRFTALGHGQVFDVRPFSVDESLELLARLAGADRIAAERDAATGIVERCGFLPLALRIAGAKLAARPHLTLARLAARLDDARALLDELAYADLAVRTSVAPTYEALDDRSRTAFRRLSLIDGTTLPDWLAAYPLSCPVADVERTLDPLVDCRLLDVGVINGEVRFSFHDLLKVYGRERAAAEEPSDALIQVLRTTLEGALSVTRYAYDRLGNACNRPPGLGDPGCPPAEEVAKVIRAAPVAWFDLERDGLVGLIVQCGDSAALDEATHRLAGLLSAYLEIRGCHRDWQHTHEIGIRAARGCGDAAAEAFLLRRLAELNVTRNRHDEAARQITTSIEIAGRLGDRSALAYGKYVLGTIRHTQARFTEARDCFVAAQTALADTDDRLTEAHVWYGLGAVHQDLGALREALSCFERALAAFRKADDRRGAAHLMRWLASLYIKLDRDAEADEILAECLEANRALGDRLGEAYVLQAVGERHGQLGQWDAGEAALTASEKLFCDLGVGSGRALVLRTLGALHMANGSFAEAADELATALELFRALNLPLGEARTRLMLGDLRRAADDAVGACEHWQAALRLFEQLGVPESEQARARLTA